jgi:hypothetical protein
MLAALRVLTTSKSRQLNRLLSYFVLVILRLCDKQFLFTKYLHLD